MDIKVKSLKVNEPAAELETKLQKVREVINLAAQLGITDALKSVGISYYIFDSTINKYPELSSLYDSARKERADNLANDVVSIADNETNPHKARVRIEARRWLASKMNAAVYGDKIDIQVSAAPDLSGALEAARNRALGVVVTDAASAAISHGGLDNDEAVIDSSDDESLIDDMMG